MGTDKKLKLISIDPLAGKSFLGLGSLLTGAKVCPVPIQLGAHRLHPQDYLYKPPDYKDTHRFLGMVIVILCPKVEGNCLLLFKLESINGRTNRYYHVHYFPTLLELCSHKNSTQ